MFGNRLRLARIRHGLSQADLASQLNAAPQQVQKWEKSPTAPNGETIATIAKTLGVTADYLLGLVEDLDETMAAPPLTPKQQRVIDLMRRGDKLEAVKEIVNNDAEAGD